MAASRVILWALPAGTRDRLHEKPLTSFPLTREQADKVQAAAAKDGWHGFRRAVETDAPPDFVAGIRGAKRKNPLRPRVICAWCGKILRQGSLPATHGICPKCEKANFPELEKPRRNPPTPVTVQKFRTASGHLVSGQVLSLQYVNIGSARQRPYSHPFDQSGVEMWALANGSLLIRHPRFRLWEDLVVGDDE